MKFSTLPKLDQAKLFAEMVSMPGWALLKEMIEDGEILSAKQELEENDHKSLDEVRALQYKITVSRHVLGIPQTFIDNCGELVQAAKEDVMIENIDDPYFSNVEEMDRKTQEEIEDVDNSEEN